MTGLTEGYTAIPNWLVRESTLGKHELLVLIALSGRANQYGECWPSYPTLAAEARCSESSARRALRNLVARGLVTVRHRTGDDGGPTSNLYRVNLNVSKVRVDAVGPPSRGGVT